MRLTLVAVSTILLEPVPPDDGMEGSGLPPGMTQVYLTTPPELYPVFVARQIGALALVSVVVGGLALWVITWRRPNIG